MWLDLKDIIVTPGAVKSFECDISTDGLFVPSVKDFTAPPHAVGQVKNSAGALDLTGVLTAEMLCVCDRCGREFLSEKVMELAVPLSAELTEDSDAELWPVIGGGIDLDTVLASCFILDMETKFLCSPDCKGLCPKCGKNLNDGPCGCVKDVDPRLAVLGQLLDNK